MTIPKDITPVSVVETPKSHPSPSADPFAEVDYVFDSQSPSQDSTSLESQGSFFIPDWEFPYQDVSVDSIKAKTPIVEHAAPVDLSGDSIAAVESGLVCSVSELPRGEGVGAGRTESHDSDISDLSGSGVKPAKATATATWLCDDEYDLEKETKRRKKIW